MLALNKYLAALVLCNYVSKNYHVLLEKYFTLNHSKAHKLLLFLAIKENPENVYAYLAKRSFCWEHLGNAVHERYFTNATTDASFIGMPEVIHMLGKKNLLEL
jgi:hypothetical protein